MIFKGAQTFHGSASAKFILLGEHFVVHGGVPALSFPLGQLQTKVDLELQSPSDGILCEAFFQDRQRPLVQLPLVGAAMTPAIHLAVDVMGIDLKKIGLQVRSQSNFPVSRGFGSSASFSLALAKAMAQMNPENTTRIPELVNRMECLFHGNPSGVDAATILSERPIRYENKKVVTSLVNRAADFILLNSGERVGCKELVADMTRQRQANLSAWQERAMVMTDLVEKCQQGLISGNTSVVGKTVQLSHEILSDLGLSTRPIEIAIQEGLRLGAISGKISGAGAGGAVVLVASPGSGEGIARKMLDQGFDILAVEKAHDAKTSLGN